jgi:hypothetical protein
VRRSRNSAILFVGCLAFLFAGNSLASRLMAGEFSSRAIARVLFPVAFNAIIVGQLGLHSIWCVLAPLHWAKRLVVGTASAMVLFGGLLILPFLAGTLDAAELAAPLLSFPLFLLAAQTPLWIMRMWFRWRIVHRDDATSARFEPLRIGDLLIAMAAIGMVLAAAQASQTLMAGAGDRSIAGLVVAALVIMVISATTALPAVVAGLHARRLPLALRLAFAAHVGVVAGYVALIVALGRGRMHWEVYVQIPVLAGGVFVTLTAPMLIARRLGYRLLWGRG